MGWFWQTPPRSPAEGKPAPANQTQTQAQAPQKRRDDPETDPEIAKFLDLFQTELRGDKPDEPSSKPAAASEAPESAKTPSSSSWFSRRSQGPPSPPSTTSPSTASSVPAAAAAGEGEEEDIATSLLPREMSCRDAFDQAYHCNGLGGQWNAIYRYGEMRQCSELWSDFWFCMRSKSLSPERRAAEIRDRFRAREARKYYAPGARSSEDVWESRDRKVEPGTAFATPVPRPADTVDDAEWNRIQTERRRRISEEMG